MIFLTFPLMIAALMPVILLEVWVAKPLLGTSYGKTTWVIAVANVASMRLACLLDIQISWTLTALCQGTTSVVPQEAPHMNRA